MSRTLLVAALLFILLVAGALRLHRLGEACLSLDEASSWRVSSYALTPLVWHCAANVHPPGYFLILKFWTTVCGDSPVAMRSLSVAFGCLTVAAGFILAAGFGLEPPDGARLPGAGVVAAMLIALAPLQVGLSQAVRMYALGACLTLVTSWFLLKAIRSCPKSTGWWIAYGVSTAAFFYVHNYAIFTFMAQTMFALGAALRDSTRQSLGVGVRQGIGFVMAAALAAMLYSPWLPVVLAQAREVSAGYWIATPKWPGIVVLFSNWLWGDDWGAPIAVLGLGLLVVGGVIVGRARDGLGLCLLLQAVTPWLCALLISWYGAASVIQERYFAFAQVCFICFAARALVLGLKPYETCVAGGFFGAVLTGAVYFQAPSHAASVLASFPDAAATIADRFQPGDVIAVSRPGDVNLVRFYLKRHGVRDADVRCRLSRRSGSGHRVHVGSLNGADVLWSFDPPSNLRRYWRISRSNLPAPAAPAGMVERFRSGALGDTPWTVQLYEHSALPED
jgi:mannosyltransferase